MDRFLPCLPTSTQTTTTSAHLSFLKVLSSCASVLVTNNALWCTVRFDLNVFNKNHQMKGSMHTHSLEFDLSATHLLSTPQRAVAMALLFTTHRHIQRRTFNIPLSFSPLFYMWVGDGRLVSHSDRLLIECYEGASLVR